MSEIYEANNYENWMPMFAKVGVEDIKWERFELERIRNGDTWKAIALKAWFSNGALAHEAEFKDDKLEGKVVVYFESGKKRAESTYKANRFNGPHRTWYENGARQSDCIKGCVSKGVYWRKDGSLERTFGRDENGDLIEKFYDKNSNEISKGKYLKL